MANRLMKRCSSVIWGNQITWKSKPQKNIISHLSESWLSKRQEIISVGKNVKKREPLCPVDGTVNCWSHYGKLWRFLKNSNNNNKKKTMFKYDYLTIGSSSLGYVLGKNTNLKTCMHPPVHCSIIYNSQNMAACSLID